MLCVSLLKITLIFLTQHTKSTWTLSLLLRKSGSFWIEGPFLSHNFGIFSACVYSKDKHLPIKWLYLWIILFHCYCALTYLRKCWIVVVAITRLLLNIPGPLMTSLQAKCSAPTISYEKREHGGINGGINTDFQLSHLHLSLLTQAENKGAIGKRKV